ncbi:hypothetical protein CKO_04975 [Citrobacter koseri ATCC BAA-895]|uniref:Uncharacterized protein n=1 Tax=Citrobacter koseri (strain ATCC BAA-895 / CDC 4225-83 / SGSC4696) TaxID=290338 RepID=A8ARA7_CITK8|nr:hypothetical protein CKO_04975 [Citrobacter koseri ATCC BAA-895]
MRCRRRIRHESGESAYPHSHCINPGKFSFHRVIIIVEPSPDPAAAPGDAE